ncbi:MAG: RNase adaptor protein RapZ, partial [Candidatus Desulfovibrio faecigallinarum]|nr:RNase adaptor protein RapZ [Candidatus Desulfovibrio faecigallinarum]
MDKSPSPAGSPQDKKDAEAPAPQTLGKSAALPSGTPARALPEARASSRLCVITGLSGSGKSTAMQVFEDLMYFTVDGLPARMAPEMVNLMSRPSMAHFKGIALGLDIR